MAGPEDSASEGSGSGTGIESLDSLLVAGEIGDTSQVHLFRARCAVSVIPTDSVLEAYRKEAGEDGWTEVVADNEYYASLVMDTLQAHGVPVTHASREKRFVRFLASDGATYTIDLAKGKDLWGLLLFDGKEKPVLWHGTELSPEWERRMLSR